MNKQQIKTIVVMLALAIAFGAFVFMKDGVAPAGHEEAGGHEEQAAHQDDGVIRFSDAQVTGAGITLETAGPQRLDTFVRMPGQIALNEDRTAHVTPRASGAVEAVPAKLGQVVRKGEVLAIVASADVAQERAVLAAAQQRLAYARTQHAAEKSLWEEKISARQDYLKATQELREAEIALRESSQKLAALGAGGAAGASSNRLQVRAPFDGVVVEKHVAMGEIVNADTRIFTITDLATVWADVVVPAKDLDIVRVGTDAVIRSIASSITAPGKVSFVSALIGEESRSARARVVLANPQGAWRPGLAVNIDIVTGTAQAKVVVARAALQTLEGKQVVYKRVAQGFVAQPVEAGRSDGQYLEIVSGLAAGDRYAAAGSFAIKAEQGKGAAAHHD